MGKKKVAAIVTEYRLNSHAEMIVGRLLGEFGYEPRVEVVSLYTDQVPSNDLSREIAGKYGIPIYPTIDETIAHGSPDQPVEGIVIIGEHGKYGWNEKAQHMYPRRRFMEETFKATDRLGIRVPVFLDKHLSYNQRDTEWIYDQVRSRGIPFMGGSSIPYSQPVPSIDPSFLQKAKELFVVSHGGNESYGFHAMEVLQSLAEFRIGAETGVAAVEAWAGPAMWEAMERGEWPEELMLQALSTQTAASPRHPRDICPSPAFFKISYLDGTLGYVAQLESCVRQWSYAVRNGRGATMKGIYPLGGGRPFHHFDKFTEKIEDLILYGEPPCPVEKILLTTGMINAAMEALFQKRKLPTPELAVSYSPNLA